MNQNIAIQFNNLSKTYGRAANTVNAVSNLELSVDAGLVYGFLGPNGAGKSTTIRMLMDLVRPTRGTVQVFGNGTRSNPDALKSVGALVEGASFYNHLSGRRNLEVLALTSGNLEHKRIDKLLEQVGLGARAFRRVEGYSTGMKQRLGIAAALLSDPDLIILDEPTNGLDPAGIQDIRAFIQNLAKKEGKTVFLSSHLLNEVEQICDRVAIIDRGELVREGKISNLLADRETTIRIQASPEEKARLILEDKWRVAEEADWLIIEASQEDSASIVRQLVTGGVAVHQIIVQRQSLEDYLMDVINREVNNN